MRPTPETDAVRLPINSHTLPADVVYADFARTLERARNEWREIAERLDAKVLTEQHDHNLTVDRLLAERQKVALLRGFVEGIIASCANPTLEKVSVPLRSFRAVLEVTKPIP